MREMNSHGVDISKEYITSDNIKLSILTQTLRYERSYAFIFATEYRNDEVKRVQVNSATAKIRDNIIKDSICHDQREDEPYPETKIDLLITRNRPLAYK